MLPARTMRLPSLLSLRQGADVNAREEDGTTALAWAASHSNVAIAEVLLNKGANPDLTNELGIGPLSLAISNGSSALVKLLLSKGANPNVARENGETPLMTAARLGQVETMRLLLSRGANANAAREEIRPDCADVGSWVIRRRCACWWITEQTSVRLRRHGM